LSKGKSIEATEKAPQPATVTEDKTKEVLLNWSGPADKVLVGGDTPFNKSNEDKTLIYDLKTEKVTVLDSLMWFPDNRPVRPDGKGILLLLGEDQGYSFADWQGKVKEFKEPKEIREKPGDLWHAEWSKNIFRMRTPTRAFELDTDAGKARVIKDKLVLVDAPGKAQQVWSFAGAK
jgi:hypothetical protein